MMRRVEMDRRDGHHAVLQRFVVGVFPATPRLACAGNPIIRASPGIDFLNNGIFKAASTEAGHFHSLDGSK